MDIKAKLEKFLPDFYNFKVYVANGLTHTHVKIDGESVKPQRSFHSDIYVYKRTGEHSIARIDTCDTRTLAVIQDCLLDFTF